MSTLSPQSPDDQGLRAMSEDGSFRVIAINATTTARGVLEAQQAGSEIAPRLAELATATVLLRLAMSPDYRLQTVLKHPEHGSIVADSHPDGVTRALIQQERDNTISLGPKTLLSVHRDTYTGKLHQGIVETLEGYGLGESIAGYLKQSEQIHSVVGLRTLFDDQGQLTYAGGFLVQLLPDAHVDTLAAVTERLEQTGTQKVFEVGSFENEGILKAVFEEVPYRILGEDLFRFGCNCSEERILGALATLSPAERAELAASNEPIEIGCDYCNVTYSIDPATLG
ncbi:Hsp33 family molecular chaperone HslO [Lujinxingia vulgaris]|uniref:Hsp33 family molecular chaperone HslO n=1 Tax=Lujinxingia vulgaris TaxID=2600176 RepID=A0A5C6XA74_9DELT|nr:Hsp33 family molecular chaperone HslO [Lujinxingia vulgaris]TXD38256.1 Hsp33 family molecular chaperone HslO [Lujinxingia vulgaris]